MQRISMIEPLEGRQLFAVSVGEMPTAVRNMKQAIRAGRVDCAVVFSTSRLHRKTFPALAFGTGEYFEYTTDRTKVIRRRATITWLDG